MKKKTRFPNIKFYLLSIITVIFAFYTIKKPITSRLSLIKYVPFIFDYFALAFAILAIIFLTLILTKAVKDNRYYKIKKVINIILSVFLVFYLFEYLFLAFTRSLIYSSTLPKIPDKSQFIDSVSYIIIHHANDFLNGILVTLELSLVGTALGLLIALFLVSLRTLKITNQDSELLAFIKKIGISFSKIYINIFRGTPMMVQAVIIYYLLPLLISKQFGIPQSNVDKIFTVIVAGFVVVTLNTAAYLTEVLRGGIESIDKGQMEAARSLGLTYWQAMVKIVFPQAIKNTLPSICNEFIINVKDTSVLNVIGVAELFFMTQDAKMQYYRTYEPFIIAAAIYLILTLSASRLLSYIEKKMNLEAKPLPSSN